MRPALEVTMWICQCECDKQAKIGIWHNGDDEWNVLSAVSFFIFGSWKDRQSPKNPQS